MTGEDLITFVNGSLFPYLKKFRETAEDPDTIDYNIGQIFSEIINWNAPTEVVHLLG
jgi:type I restriction enzyme M protein